MLRNGNELSIVAMAADVLKGMKVEQVDAMAEGAVPYDLQTNGAAESAVKLCKVMLKAYNMTLENDLMLECHRRTL